MSGEERRLVLEMIAAGRITPEEGLRLLEALGGGDGESGGVTRPGAVSSERKARAAVGIAAGVFRRLDIFPWVGAELTDGLTRTGEFGGEGPREVEIELVNGRLEVKGWEQAAWQLRVETRSRGREIWKAADLVAVEAGERSLKVRSARVFGGGHSVSAVLNLPPGQYVVRARASNGRLAARSLRCRVLDFDVSNGRIEVADVEGDEVKLGASHGTVLADVSARQMTATTSTGSIAVVPGEIRRDSYVLRTSRGSLRVDCPDPEAGYRIDATASQGTIEVQLPGLPRQVARGVPGGAALKVATPGWDGRERYLDVRLVASEGSITVSYQAPRGGEGND